MTQTAVFKGLTKKEGTTSRRFLDVFNLSSRRAGLCYYARKLVKHAPRAREQHEGA